MDYWDKFTQDWMEHEEKIDFCQQNLNLLSSEDLDALYDKLKKLHPSSNFNTNYFLTI